MWVIKLKKDIIFPADDNKNDVIYNQSVIRRVFLDMLAFLLKRTLYFI